MSDCIFCKIIAGKIPSHKLWDSDTTYAFLDIGPLSKGHALVIPKHHGAKLTEIPDDSLTETLNNGREAHQLVDHVHFHYIPKPNQEEGLGIEWPTKQADQEELKSLAEKIRAKM